MKPITLVKDAAGCCACGACLTVCPKQAITMEADTYGFQYPKIDTSACIQCGKCVQICGYAMDAEGNIPIAAYAAVGKRDELVKNSASGGVFAALAQSCMDEGGLVAGAVMDCENSHADVYHLLSDQKADLLRMQGSKYVQSEAWRCYRELLRAVKEGKLVLFSGTPCQVSAVKHLTGDPDNLITVDLVCHGVPSLQMLNDYLQILSKRLHGRIEGFRFRDKSSRKTYCARVDIRKRKKRSFLIKSKFLSFYKFFLEGCICRENCYTCPYANMKRISDITIGDYWGVEQFHGADMRVGRMAQRKDWSCVLVNTEKGRQFLTRHEQELCLVPTEAAWVAENNRQLNAPSKKPERREELLRSYAKSGYAVVESAFIQENGGALRFYWRMARDLYSNTGL